MTDYQNPSDYGVLTEPATLRIQRLLPGPVERVWSYLIDSDLRRQWLAAGDMEMKVGTTFEFVWRNDELTNPPGQRPPGYSEEHRLESRITELDPPHKLAIAWGSTGGVSFELEPMGNQVMLTVTHHRVPDQSTLLSVSSGWHAHLDILVARLEGSDPEPFWDSIAKLKEEYGQRLSA
ncbi:activator of Hsp90 ATPase 1 family protein [Marinobacter lipolyticus SM19]|uniref:Activator of Hsp90 ATPase 1 family protein n=1 Tax=Marinobacter lipolyticus SM19 TaxID=1318628 RepID=R8AX19_9GAMM|nr:SRPBCC family protein [Marinobacter lipolyticus]EON90893.1 activator of Hsp90 ATPase 1 family protein [Marinobacter lipolyticus SM19]